MIGPVKALFVVKPKSMSREDIDRAEKECGIVIVECAEPDRIRLVDPPIDAGIDVQAKAAIELMRVIATGTTTNYSRDWLMTWLVNAIIRERRPDPVPRVEKVKK